jgi:hypothetical protein
MKKRKTLFHAALAAASFACALTLGAGQAIATDGTQAPAESCSAWACRQECGVFGGDLGPGGPGKPLQCYCCG